MRLSLMPGGMMMILVEITYEDGTLKTSSIQLKSGEK
jgi:predicted DNA-binding antitoxin AbrB/MazE fold protein